MNFIGIIPARYGSTRLAGKPLIDIAGKPMIQWVYEKTREVLEDVYVATDDVRIVDAVENFGGKAVLTSTDHNTGTNRCLEAYEKIISNGHGPFDVIVNIQGDEPLLHAAQIKALKGCFNEGNPEMATLVIPVEDALDLENESEVFVTFDHNFNALYFSRSVIPYLKGVPRADWIKRHIFHKHLGMYAYTYEALKKFAALPQSNLENTEGLEQLRWLESSHEIKIGITEHQSIPVDTQEDLMRIRTIMESQIQ